MPGDWQPHLSRAILAAAGLSAEALAKAGDAGNLASLKSVDRKASHIIGIDGGVDLLVAIGIMPDAVMGDMDSARGQFENRVSLPDPNQSDLEKSIVYLLARGVQDFTLYGALGGARMDHHIANVDLLAKYAPQCRIRLIAENYVVEGLSVQNTAPDGVDFMVQPQSTLGVLPAGGAANVTLRGTAYDLTRGEIQTGTHGASNRAVDKTVHIQVHSSIVRFIYQPA